ncbi:hypothetical protein BV25DRAFT_1701303 [Artomyces pyxidatus]|uniref:Uncharacterized protein n=1 Tax=Artomyces pyxidatus TaxID=48021 RepID=A0ACB8TAE7_9AGAM|nr:hypothetical protein BV25DRAFT_1701303 [Artomyces pyxidatus]
MSEDRIALSGGVVTANVFFCSAMRAHRLGLQALASLDSAAASLLWRARSLDQTSGIGCRSTGVVPSRSEHRDISVTPTKKQKPSRDFIPSETGNVWDPSLHLKKGFQQCRRRSGSSMSIDVTIPAMSELRGKILATCSSFSTTGSSGGAV